MQEGDNINTVKKKAGSLIGVNMEVGLGVNIKKTKYTLISHE
jgi:hypothetical protein